MLAFKGAKREINIHYKDLRAGLWVGPGIHALRDDLRANYGVELSAKTTFTISGARPEQVQAAAKSLHSQLSTKMVRENRQLRVEA